MNFAREEKDAVQEPEMMDPKFHVTLRRMLVEHARSDEKVRAGRHRPILGLRFATLGIVTAAVGVAVVVGVGIAGQSERNVPVAFQTASPAISSTIAVHCLPTSELSTSSMASEPSAEPVSNWASRMLDTAPAVQVEVTADVVDEDQLRMACATVGATVESDSMGAKGPQSLSGSSGGALTDLKVEFQMAAGRVDAGICVIDQALMVLPGAFTCAQLGLEAAPAVSERAG